MADGTGLPAVATRNFRLRRACLADIGFAALLLALLCLVYAPSLEHAPRADQWCFLVDTLDQHTFWDIFTHCYSYNRTRRIMPGDTDLYRPLLFAVLAAEKAIFAADFAGYQAIGIFLHWSITCLLLLLMRTTFAFAPQTSKAPLPPLATWGSQLLPYAVCLFFAFNKSVQELVIWSHLHGYLVFLIFLLSSLTLLLRCCRLPASWKSILLWGSWGLGLLSAFTYEMGQFYAVLAGLFLAVTLPSGTTIKRRLAFCVLFASIMVVYQAANHLDRWIHRGQFVPESVRARIKERALSKDTLNHSKRFLAYTVAQPFFPSLKSASLAGERVVMGEAEWSRDHFHHFPPALLASILTAVAATALGFFSLVRLCLQRDRLFLFVILLTLSLYSVYLAMTVLGRMNIRPGAHCLSTNSYYAHMGLLLALVPIAMLWQSAGRSRAAATVQWALIIGLIALACYSAPAVWCLNESIAQELRSRCNSIADLRALIETHRKEADFSLAFDLDSCRAIGPQYGVPITTILFKRYLNPTHPKYVIHFADGKLNMMTYNEWQANRSSRNGLCPELVAIGSSYNFYRDNGRYYGVLYWDGFYDPARRDHAYLIKAQTLEEAQRQKQAKLAEQEDDIRSRRFFPPSMGNVLLEEGYKGFNLIGLANRIYAIPQGEGAFELSRVLSHGYSRSYAGNTIDEVKSQIDEENVPLTPEN